MGYQWCLWTSLIGLAVRARSVLFLWIIWQWLKYMDCVRICADYRHNVAASSPTIDRCLHSYSAKLLLVVTSQFRVSCTHMAKCLNQDVTIGFKFVFTYSAKKLHLCGNLRKRKDYLQVVPVIGIKILSDITTKPIKWHVPADSLFAVNVYWNGQ